MIGRVLAAPLVWLVRLYQLVLSPLLPASCRYTPSCSAYAVTALRRYGLARGTLLAARRLLRCHPWAPGGVDHVPPTWEDRHLTHHGDPGGTLPAGRRTRVT